MAELKTFTVDNRRYDRASLTPEQNNLIDDLSINDEASKIIGYINFCLAVIKDKQLKEIKDSLSIDELLEPEVMPDLNYNREAVTSFNTYQMT